MTSDNASAPTTEPAWQVLRVAAALCFVGHGAFGIIGKPEWLPFFAVVGIGPVAARPLMLLIGIVDIAAGVAVLLSPRPALLLYMMVWAVWTAALRPLSGLPVWEFIERAGNYGVPLALLFWCGAIPRNGWFARLRPGPLIERARHVRSALAASTALLLVGHGALALLGKPLLLRHAGVLSLGRPAVTVQGWIEIALGVVCLVRPARGLLIVVVAWKVATELLFVLSGAPIWEFIERGGSYGAPLALALIVRVGAQRSPRRGGFDGASVRNDV